MSDACGWCGSTHAGECPRIQAMDYYPDGTIKRVEFRQERAGWKDTSASDGMPLSAWLNQKQFWQTAASPGCSYVLSARPHAVWDWALDRGWTRIPASRSRCTFITANGEVIKVAFSLAELIGLPHGTRLYLGPDYEKVSDYSVIMEHAAAHRLMIVDA